MFHDLKVIDSHIHYSPLIKPAELISLMDYCDTDTAALLVVPDKNCLTRMPCALRTKYMYPDRIFVFADLDVSAYFTNARNIGSAMAAHVKRVLDCGCDGIKMIEGKPEIRKQLPIPDFDDPVWDPYFQYMQENKVPIIWHVNDPKEFWDAESIPKWAKKQGWFYDESFIDSKKQYSQVFNVLDKYPELNIVFAHFFFLSGDLDSLSEIFDKYPNVKVDLAPGIEMYHDFSEHLDVTRLFFEKYQDRILYATDLCVNDVLVDGSQSTFKSSELQRSTFVKEFLASKEEVNIDIKKDPLLGDENFSLNPLALDKQILEKIFSSNFTDFVSQDPKAVNISNLLKQIRRIRIKLFVMSIADKTIEADFSPHANARRFFKKILRG